MSSWEDYTYPNSNVLKNKADIRDPAELQRFERGVTAIRIQELRESPVRGDYGLEHMQEIHRQVFKDVYEWAGRTRDVDIAKGPPGDRTVFAFTEELPAKGERIKSLIKDANNMRGMDRQGFAEKMGEIYAAANELHPFREGNGRTTREYLHSLAQESGHSLDFTKVDRATWNEAAKQSARGNLDPIKKVFLEVASVDRAVAFDKAIDRAGEKDAMARHPELDKAFKSLHEVRQAGGDLGAARSEISKVLHSGHLGAGSVSMEESRRVIDLAAQQRGLLIRDADRLGGRFKGEVVGVSSHHVMLKVGDMVAIRYERDNLERNVVTGDRVVIDHSPEKSSVYEHGEEPQKDRGRESMQMEREHNLAT